MLRNKYIAGMFALSVVLVVAAAVVGSIGLPEEPGGELIIRYDVSDKEPDLLGTAGTFFGLLGIVSFMTFLNLVLALEVYGREKFLSYAIAAVTLVITGLFLVASVNIAEIN